MAAERAGSISAGLVVFAIAAVAQAWIALNPGWFSHDELQWGVRADVATFADLPWVDWFRAGDFQWRPLTFNGWLAISHLVFDAPVAWHSLWVATGSAIAAVFASLLLRLGVARRVAVVAALVFALGPYATYVHGWVATLADLLVLAIGLELAHALLTVRARAAAARVAKPAGTPGPPSHRWRRFDAGNVVLTSGAIALAATALALMAKESAVAFAPLLGLCWALWPRERVLAGATIGSALVVAGYLVLRLPVLLLPGDASAYALDPARVPENWLAYHLYVLRLSNFEIAGLWNAPTGALVLAAVFWGALWTMVARARGWRLAAAMVGGGSLLLAPVLAIPMTANQYGYVFSAWCVACVALAWPRFGRASRIFVGVFALVVAWHGANVQREMRAAGERQAVFQPALVDALRGHDGELRLHVDPDEAWLYRRLTHQVPSWRGVPVGERVRWVDSPERAQWIVGEDGSMAAR